MAKAGRRCTVCDHEQIEKINLDLLAGANFSATGRKFGLHSAAVTRHVHNHLPQAVEIKPKAIATDSVLTELSRLKDSAQEVEEIALDDDKPVLQLRAIREQTRIIETTIKLAELLYERDIRQREIEAGKSISQSVEWIALRTAIIVALHPYPEARQAVMAALGGQYAIIDG